MDEKHIKEEWIRRGFSFGVWEDPPGQIWRDFVHDEDELFMCIEGTVKLTVDGKKIIPTLWEEVFIASGSLHTVENIGKSDCRWLYGYKKP